MENESPVTSVTLRELSEGLFTISEASPVSSEGRPVWGLHEIAKQLLQPEFSSTLSRLVAWFNDNQSRQSFWSAKLIREKVFRNDAGLLEAFQSAIDQGILETYRVDNPKRPAFPTTAVRLNKQHPYFKNRP
jgi:hypothetical protein